MAVLLARTQCKLQDGFRHRLVAPVLILAMEKAASPVRHLRASAPARRTSDRLIPLCTLVEGVDEKLLPGRLLGEVERKLSKARVRDRRRPALTTLSTCF